MDLIFVTGTAGSGKSLLTSALKDWYVRKSQDAIAVNLDPGVKALPYQPDVDVRKMIDLEGLMKSYNLGPNGALILATDMVATRLGELQEEIDLAGPECVIVDTPGQVELFAFRESGPYIARELKADSKLFLFLMDPPLASTPSNFLSLVLLSTSVGLRMNLPRISVLTKKDVAPERVRDIMGWSKSSTLFEEGLASTRDGEEYALYSELFRGVRKLSAGVDLYPISSATLDGFIALVGEISRIARGGEEVSG